MISKSELKILDGFAYILECIAEECFGDAKGAIFDLIQYVKKYAEIPAALRAEIIQTLENSFEEKQKSGPKAMAVCLSRMNRKLWLAAKTRLPRSKAEPINNPSVLRQIIATLDEASKAKFGTAFLPNSEFFELRLPIGKSWPSMESAEDAVQEISAAINPTLLEISSKHHRQLMELKAQSALENGDV